MSRFASKTATARFVLQGSCQCPNQPHDEDWIELRTELGTSDVLALDDMVTPVERLGYLATAWNLKDDDGADAPLDEEHIGALFQDTFEAFDVWFRANVRAMTLPKASAAPSRNGSRAAASSARGRTTGH